MKLIKPTTLIGPVMPYKGNGRKLGYPTANIKTDTDLDDGVYFGYANLGEYQNHPALIFIGTPTTMGDTERRVEAHLLDIVDQDYYGLPITMELQHFYRPNETFASIDDLLKAMKQDEATARAWFAKH
jgi:riboflavin kinase / FMN adenylyltransferase